MTNLPSFHALEAQAMALGFQKVGVVTLDQLPLDASALENWIFQGFNAEMQWMVEHLEKRIDPKQLMPGTQSILCVALNYYSGPLAPEAQAKIARYAQGDDYHKVVKTKLKALLKWLKTFDPKIEGRPLTDSAPILEKALAIKAGLGWQGKHSNIILQQQGSWFFLGELLLNVSFPDAPVPKEVNNLCGSCTRCITACPTQAIVEPYVVDANKCLSYWTIEYRGEQIPDTIQPHMNDWLFGCDICQEVCPWNIKFQQETTETAFLPRPWNRNPKLDEIATLSESRFKVRYRHSPIKRAKMTGLQRNAKAIQAIQSSKASLQPSD